MIKATNDANQTLLCLKDVIVDVINTANIMRVRTILLEERLVLSFGHGQIIQCIALLLRALRQGCIASLSRDH
jgi:hypothetical protein